MDWQLRRSSFARQCLAVVLLFGLVYACSLAFVYVEGDDASSAAYHAAGRLEAIQPPYAEYQSGADLLLRLLPSHEPTLRVTAIAVSAAAMAMCVVLMAMLASDLLSATGESLKSQWPLVLLLAMPEFFYLGLVYQPSAIGMCCMLLSHLMLRRELRDTPSLMRLLLAAALFGVGASFRWSLVLYGWLILCDWILEVGRPRATGWGSHVLRAAHAVLWGCVALTVWLAVLRASGYGAGHVYSFLEFTRAWAAYRLKWQVLLTADLALLTPAAILLIVLGLVFLARTQRRTALFVCAGTIPAIPYLTFWPKELIWFFPILVLCVLAGYVAIVKWRMRSRLGWLIQTGLIVLLLIPWVVGIRATAGDAAWGPGFELQPYDRPSAGHDVLALRIGSGAAVSTPEGPRPLWGHGAVLLGGNWRRLAHQLAADSLSVVRTALDGGLPILVMDGGTGALVCELARLRFMPKDPMYSGIGGPLLSHRRFSNSAKAQVIMVALALDHSLWAVSAGELRELRTVVQADRVVAIGYPGTVRSMFTFAPGTMTRIGLTAAVIDLQALESKATGMGWGSHD